jgi:hypothetical protein
MYVVSLIEYDQPGAAPKRRSLRSNSCNPSDRCRSPLVARIEFDDLPVKITRKRMGGGCFADAGFSVQDPESDAGLYFSAHSMFVSDMFIDSPHDRFFGDQ